MSRGHRDLTAAVRDTQPGRSQSRHHPQIKGAKRVDEDEGAKTKESVPFGDEEDEGVCPFCEKTKESVPFRAKGVCPLQRSLSPSERPLQRCCSSGEEADCPHSGTEGVCPLPEQSVPFWEINAVRG